MSVYMFVFGSVGERDLEELVKLLFVRCPGNEDAAVPLPVTVDAPTVDGHVGHQVLVCHVTHLKVHTTHFEIHTVHFEIHTTF